MFLKQHSPLWVGTVLEEITFLFYYVYFAHFARALKCLIIICSRRFATDEKKIQSILVFRFFFCLSCFQCNV